MSKERKYDECLYYGSLAALLVLGVSLVGFTFGQLATGEPATFSVQNPHHVLSIAVSVIAVLFVFVGYRVYTDLLGVV